MSKIRKQAMVCSHCMLSERTHYLPRPLSFTRMRRSGYNICANNKQISLI